MRLDDPPLDVKLYFFDLAKQLGGAWLEVGDEGVRLKKKGARWASTREPRKVQCEEGRGTCQRE